MPDLTANRTLVKSPPELWEELSEVERLARHLGAFGEITITKLEPEHTVAWEGEHASGTVSIEPSGWGTKVTLRAELPEREEPEPEPEPEPVAAPAEEAQHIGDKSGRFRAELEPEPEDDSGEESPPRGLWGWLFRRRTEPVTREPEPVVAEPEPEPVIEEPAPVAEEPEPEPEPDPEPEPEPEPVLEDATLDPERARVILDEALDTLGAAHHRPFSRS